MSPEQARGDPVGEASDLYSLGALLYRCLTGETPVDVGGLDEVGARERVAKAGPPDASELPDELAAVVRRAMAPDPEDRFESAEAFLEALEAVDLEPEPVRPA
jgi:serine/threonine-protein kinase